MLEVHPPHEAAHSWKDFFIHIATIVVGLLIAVGLEQTVEWFHHRHQMHVAREHIHDEVLVNQRIVLQNERGTERIIANLEHSLAVVQSLQGKKPAPAETPDFSFGLQGFYDAAYTNARDNGTLSLMPYGEAAMYSDAYMGSAFAQQSGLALWNQLHEAKAALHGKSLSQLDADEILPVVSAISEAREKAELAQETFKVQQEEWEAVLSGHFRNDIVGKGK